MMMMMTTKGVSYNFDYDYDDKKNRLKVIITTRVHNMTTTMGKIVTHKAVFAKIYHNKKVKNISQ